MGQMIQNEKGRDRLYRAASYLDVDEDNYIMQEGNYHPYCELSPEYKSGIDPKEVTKKPSVLKRLCHTFF